MSDYLNFSLQTRTDVKDWVLKRLGYPLVQVEITEDQLDICINDAVEEFTEYVIQDEMFYALNLESYPTSGYTMPSNTMNIFSIQESNINDGVNGGVDRLFSTYNQMWNYGMLPDFMSGMGGGGAGGWINYELTLQYLELVKRLTGGGMDFEYNQRTKVIKLFPDPTKTRIRGWVVLGCHVIRPEEQQYGENWVKYMTLAIAKEIIGQVRSKYKDTRLPGGGTIDSTIKNEGLKERKELRTELREKYNNPRFFVG